MAKRGRPKTVQKQKKKSRVKRFIGGVKRRSSSVKKKIIKHKKSLSSTILSFVPILQGVQLLSENQVSQETTNENKFKALLNGITGSFFDINLFPDVAQAHFNPKIGGALNRWTFTNIGLMLGGIIGQHFKIKHSAKLKNVGASSLLVSIFAGIMGKRNTEKASVFSNPLSTQSITNTQILISSNGGGSSV